MGDHWYSLFSLKIGPNGRFKEIMKSDIFHSVDDIFFPQSALKYAFFGRFFYEKNITKKKNITSLLILKRNCRFRNFEKWKMWKKSDYLCGFWDDFFFRNIIILATFIFVKKISSSKRFWNWFSNSLSREHFWRKKMFFF